MSNLPSGYIEQSSDPLYESEFMRAKAERKIAAVRELHKPVGAYVNPGRHERLIKVCAGCGLVDGAWQKYPCPTIRALDGTP